MKNFCLNLEPWKNNGMNRNPSHLAFPFNISISHSLPWLSYFKYIPVVLHPPLYICNFELLQTPFHSSPTEKVCWKLVCISNKSLLQIALWVQPCIWLYLSSGIPKKRPLYNLIAVPIAGNKLKKVQGYSASFCRVRSCFVQRIDTDETDLWEEYNIFYHGFSKWIS